MNAYRIDIWQGVHHNGNFSHYNQRIEIIHARNETEAKSKIKLRPANTHDLQGLNIEVNAESIYSCEKFGQVVIEPFYVYSNDRPPISVKEYREHYKKMRANIK